MEDYTELIQSIKAYDWGKSGEPLLAIDAEIRKVIGHPDQIAKLEAALLTILESNASMAAKRGVAKRLGLIAGEKSVPVLASMLVQPETSDLARYSLERMRGPSVDDAIRGALPKTRGGTRIGVMHSIGNRRDAQAVRALGQFLGDSDDATAQAAAWALGRIGGADAIRMLAAGKDRTRGRVRLEILDAYLVCARRLAAQGKKSEAVAMYNELNAEGMPAPIRRAASLGISAARG
jgi:HEAT repeat protein